MAGSHGQVVTLGAIKATGDKRSVVSHWAKFYRGEFVGRLLRDERPLPESIDALVTRAAEHYEVEFAEATATRPAGLTIVLRD